MASRVVIDWLMAREKLLVTSPQDSCMSLIENPVVVKYLTAIRCPLQDFQLFAACQLVSNHSRFLASKYSPVAREPASSSASQIHIRFSENNAAAAVITNPFVLGARRE